MTAVCGAAHPTIEGLTCRRDPEHKDGDHSADPGFRKRWHRGMYTVDGQVKVRAWAPTATPSRPALRAV